MSAEKPDNTQLHCSFLNPSLLLASYDEPIFFTLSGQYQDHRWTQTYVLLRYIQTKHHTHMQLQGTLSYIKEVNMIENTR